MDNFTIYNAMLTIGKLSLAYSSPGKNTLDWLLKILQLPRNEKDVKLLQFRLPN